MLSPTPLCQNPPKRNSFTHSTLPVGLTARPAAPVPPGIARRHARQRLAPRRCDLAGVMYTGPGGSSRRACVAFQRLLPLLYTAVAWVYGQRVIPPNPSHEPCKNIYYVLKIRRLVALPPPEAFTPGCCLRNSKSATEVAALTFMDW